MDISKRRINPQNPARTIRGRKMRKSAILAATLKAESARAQGTTPTEQIARHDDQPDQA